MDQGGVRSRAGGWVDCGSQMGGRTGVLREAKCVGEVEMSIGSG